MAAKILLKSNLRDKDVEDMIKREIGLAKKAFVMGIPTAIPYDIVKVGDLLCY